MKKQTIKATQPKSSLMSMMLWLAVGLVLFGGELFAQNYEFTTNQRRMGDQIGVEIWVKSLTPSAPNLGNMSISVLYNRDYLRPANLVANENPSETTDSVNFDLDIANPFETISSPFADAIYGFSDFLQGQAADGVDGGGNPVYIFQLDVNAPQGATGFQPSTSGRGTFVGMLKFDIYDYGNLSDAELTEIAFNPNDFIGDIQITAADGSNQTANSVFTDEGEFTIRGVKILSPNQPNQAVNRFKNPALASIDPNNGYPVYFERSGLGFGDFGTNKYGYQLDYSLDNGSSWLEIGKVAETQETVTDLGIAGEDVNDYLSGDIDTFNDYFISQGDGSALTANYGGALRVIWTGDQNFAGRSEEARLRITQLDTLANAVARQTDIDNRANFGIDSVSRRDINDFPFVIGRLFFVQLDGVEDYFRTAANYSNSTQLTVAAWVNLNTINAEDGAEPAIVASSAGAASSEEGAWMLYLHQGQFPAFRAREIDGRGPGGYIATVISSAPLGTTSDASPIEDSHANNWTHIAASVANNVVTLYVNGEIAAQSINNQAVDIRMDVTNHPIWVGVNPNGGLNAGDYLHAGVKEVQVWRAALDQEILRSHIGGVFDANNVSTVGDERLALELYYPLQGSRLDVADEFQLQNDQQDINFYIDGSLNPTFNNNLIQYRPDRAHVTLTSPVGGEGVINLVDETFPVRWAAYGLGSTDPNSQDLQIMASRDGGVTWFDAIDEMVPAMPLDQVEIEASQALWEPYNNITLSGNLDDLQGLVDIESNYSKEVLLKISGTEARNQVNIADTSNAFTVAPYFGLELNGNARVEVPSVNALNLSGGNAFIEAWISPYRFPTEDEEYFPIISKAIDEDNFHYSFRLLESGQLEFAVGSNTGAAIRTAQSDASLPIIPPNIDVYDSVWVHVGVYVNLGNGGESNSVTFYIDGREQNTSIITEQLGANVTVDNLNSFPLHIGYEPANDVDDDKYFVGQMREVRYWGNTPANRSLSGNPVSELTQFIQGALSVRADELGFFNGVDYSRNLIAAFTFNGGSFVNDGVQNSVKAFPNSSNIIGQIFGSGFQYTATEPYIKFVEPYAEQAVPNTQEDLRVRWVGFDYNRNDVLGAFRNGSDGANGADVEFSVLAGGGQIIQPYQFVASETFNAGYQNALTLPTSNAVYEFPGTSSKSQYAANLNVSITDPDENNDGIFADQAEIGATQRNGRLRLQARSFLNGSQLTFNNGANGLLPTLRAESPLFNITPPSNFTVRVLLEGYHLGSDDTPTIQNNLRADNNNGNQRLRIELFSDNLNEPGNILDSAISTAGYQNTNTAFDVANRNAGDNAFANVPFVFTSLEDGRYFVKVEHANHLPILSSHAAPFFYSGDDITSWAVESGWDFQNWDGTSSALTAQDAATNPPTIGTNYTAWGNATTDENLSEWATTALNYNEGREDANTNPLAAMVGGDVFKDDTWTINAADRAEVTRNIGGSNFQSDVTGNGLVENFDRDITFRNNGKTWSLLDVAQVQGVATPTENNENDFTNMANYDAVNPEAPELSMMFIRAEQEQLELGGAKVAKVNKANDKVQAGAFDYEVSATPYIENGKVLIPVYIRNKGAEFALGNSTFGIRYETGALRYSGMINQGIIFSDRNDMGYFPTMSGPLENTLNPISDIRTIEIIYDSFSRTNKPGSNVPYQNELLGTLIFDIVSPQDMYTFEWHEISGVLTVDGKNVTGDGTFNPINPILIARSTTVTFPNGGEQLNAGRMYTVTWTKPTVNQPVYVDFSSDNGSSWTRITENPIEASAQAYNWSTPRVNSNECLIAVVNAESGTQIDKSDAPFTLMAAPAQITRPSSADPAYKSATSDYIMWSIEDELMVRFEFSADGNSNWIPVTPSVNSKEGQVAWIIPSANTKSAIVRMINVETNEVVAVSEPFKVLSGTVDLTRPAKGETLRFGEQTNIRWNYDNVGQFDMYVSFNGGQSWDLIANSVVAAERQYGWLIPNANTDNAVIKATYLGDADLVYSTTEFFTIEGNTSVENPELAGFLFEGAVPNPVTYDTDLRFTIPNTDKVTLELYDARGTKVMTIVDNRTYAAGSHNVALSAAELSSGTYFVRLNVGGINLTREVIVIK